ncbi:MAG TPA: hypothetical protein PLK07_03060 [Rectinema sp.]|nr:hypothetical protein [Rectinema sp.]
MKKDLFELTTYEFVAVLLGISPKLHISIHLKGEDNEEEDEVIGTYEEIRRVMETHPQLLEQFEGKFFDYDMMLDDTETLRYMQHRTNDFDPELTQALLRDFEFNEFMLFDEVACQRPDPKDYALWKKTETFCYYSAKHILEAKCKAYRQQGKLVTAPFEHEGIHSCGVGAVDSLLHFAKYKRKSISNKKLQEDIASFKKDCYKIARGSLSRSEKEKWIIDVVSVLNGTFKIFKNKEIADFVNHSVHMFAVLESAFMSAPELICIKDICIQTGMCDILDEEVEDTPQDGFPSRQELGLVPLTFEEIHLNNELGKNTELRQRNICEQCLVKPCHYQYGRRRFYLCHDDEYKKSLETDRKAQRILDRLLPQEAIEEIVTDSLHSLKSTPLQEILEIFDNSYWLSLIEGYLRKIGDPTAPKLPESENKDEDFVLCDKFLFFPPDCQDEFKRWKPLYDELCGVIERNAGDKVALLAYFADLIQPIKKYSQYFHPDKNDQNSSKMSKVLLRIATCDLNPGIEEIWSLYPDSLYEVQNRPDAKTFTEEEFDDALYRSLYERLRKNRGESRGPSTWAIGAINDLIIKYGTLIDRVLRDSEIGFRLCDIQSSTGIILIEDVTTIDDEITFYWEDNSYQGPVLVEATKDEDRGDSKQERETVSAEAKQNNEIELSERAEELLNKAEGYLVNGHWHNNDKKEYAIFLKVFYCRIARKDWRNNVRWVSLPIRPLADGTTLTVDQLKGALRSYDEPLDGGIRIRFENILK